MLGETIKGEGFVLHAITLAQASIIAAWTGNPAVNRGLEDPWPVLTENMEEYLRSIDVNENAVLWGIYVATAYKVNMAMARNPELLKLDGDTYELVGISSINRINREDQWCVTGIVIGDPERHGNGLGTKVMRAQRDWIFTSFHIPIYVIRSRFLSTNPASGRMLRAIGMNEAGRSHAWTWRNDRPIDSIHCELTRPQWIKVCRAEQKLAREAAREAKAAPAAARKTAPK